VAQPLHSGVKVVIKRGATTAHVLGGRGAVEAEERRRRHLATAGEHAIRLLDDVNRAAVDADGRSVDAETDALRLD